MNPAKRRHTLRRLTLSRDTLFGMGTMGKEGHGKAGALHHGHDASHAFVIHPFSHVRRVWDVTIVLAVLYLCWYIPYTIGYEWWEPQPGLKVFMYVLDVWFIVDIFLNFRTGHVHDGHLVMDPRKIARHYLEFWFWIDVLACIPFEQILEGMYPNKASRKAIKMVKWFKIPRLLRLGRLLRYAKEYAKYWAPTALFFGVFFIMHLAACSWVGALDPCGEFIVLRESFVLEDGSVDVAPDWAWLFRDEGGKVREVPGAYHGLCSDSQLAHLYALNTLTAARMLLGGTPDLLQREQTAWFGTPFPADTLAGGGEKFEEEVAGQERASLGSWVCVWCTFWNVFGVWYMGLLVAYIFTMVSHTDAQAWVWRTRLANVKNDMERFALPAALQKRIVTYYHYLWVNNRFGETSLTSDPQMSTHIKREVAYFLYGDILMGLPFLTEAPKDLLERLCLDLEWQAALQDVRIFREGDVANHLYIVVRGTVLIIHSDKPDRSEWDVLTKYETGTCFGEIALLPGLRKRLATAVSSVVSELCYIRKDVFLDLLEQYPAVKRFTFKYVAQQRRRYSKGTQPVQNFADRTYITYIVCVD